MQDASKRVLAMYDVRGIQDYIYRNPKVKDAMGASALVEHIIEDALEDAVGENLRAQLKWCDDDNGPLPFELKELKDKDVYVLYIGGGNAYVSFRDAELCKQINRYMSKYIIEHTYSLQLATAFVDQTGDYKKDYEKLTETMQSVKSQMTDSKPLGALPVMQVELRTGYPLTDENGSEETHLKEEAKKNLLEKEEGSNFENLVLEKGEDSMLAVVHMDGNNMGQRITNLIKGKDTYEEAVPLMRLISYNIAHAYAETFNDVRNKLTGEKTIIRKIIVAGDDITYVCTASEALKSVKMFCEKITGRTMNGKSEPDDIRKYGFSVCGGIAYMHSHFPFDIAYNTAEALCDSAKKRAKEESNKDGDRVGNFVDFQICRDVRCQHLKETRTREYTAPTGESLTLRPYFIPTENDFGLGKNRDKAYNFNVLMDNIRWFANEKNLPRSFSKRLRNMYSTGARQMEGFCAFLRSRSWKLPEGKNFETQNLFIDLDKTRTAVYFDALELMDIEGKREV